jgi:hypothetical protein
MIVDGLDRKLLKSIEENHPEKISDAIRPFLREKSDRALRERVKKLYHMGYLELDKQASCVLVKLRKEPRAPASARGEPLHV